MIGVQIGDKHSYNDYGLILSSKKISPPRPRMNTVEVLGRNGFLDLTGITTGDVKYKDRKIKMTFSVNSSNPDEWNSKIETLESDVHGKKFEIIFDDDPEFYYEGIVTINRFTSYKNIGTISLEAVCDPYKYDRFFGDNWLWNPFNFETGIICKMSDIEVSGSKTVLIYGRKKRIVPEIVSDAAMTVEFKGNTFDISAGSNKIYDIAIDEGENTLKFRGNGKITIHYKGGSL